MNKILEYMAVEKPIVQFDVVEGRVSAGEASLLRRQERSGRFRRQDHRASGDEPRRQRMGKLGRERVVRDLSWQTQIPALLDAYQTARRG